MICDSRVEAVRVKKLNFYVQLLTSGHYGMSTETGGIN